MLIRWCQAGYHPDAVTVALGVVDVVFLRSPFILLGMWGKMASLLGGSNHVLLIQSICCSFALTQEIKERLGYQELLALFYCEGVFF